MLTPQLISMEGEDFPDYSGDGAEVVEGITKGMKVVGDIFGGAKKRREEKMRRSRAQMGSIIEKLRAIKEAKERGVPIPTPSIAPEYEAPISPALEAVQRIQRGLPPPSGFPRQIIPIAPRKPFGLDPSIMLPLGIGAAALLLMLAKR